MPPPEPALALPWVTPELPGVGGVLRVAPASFVVEEIPLYAASGEGTHLYVNLTRENLTTRDTQAHLERLFGAPRGSVGYAGLKDKAARTTQTFSIPVGAGGAALADEMAARIGASLPVTVNWARLHTNKLKVGHLLGNRFRITIHNVTPAPAQESGVALARARSIAARLRTIGAPNYFGPQRFGGHGDNAIAGYEVVSGRRRIQDRWLRSFLVSSYQSYLCNLYLARRVNMGAYGRILGGDVAKKYATGGIFDVQDVAIEQARFDAMEISYTAPLFGAKMRRAQGESAALEGAIEAETGLTDTEWRRAHTDGTRRLGRLLLPDLEVEEAGDAIIASFSLPKGAFATTILRELMKDDEQALPAEEAEEP